MTAASGADREPVDVDWARPGGLADDPRTRASGADRPTVRDQIAAVLALETDLGITAKKAREVADVLLREVVERAKAEGGVSSGDATVIVDLLQRVGGDPDLWTASQRRAVMHLAALRGSTGGGT